MVFTIIFTGQLTPPPVDLSEDQRRVKRDEWQELVTRLYQGILPKTFDGRSQLLLDFFRLVTPIMFERLKACGPQVEPRLEYLPALSH